MSEIPTYRLLWAVTTGDEVSMVRWTILRTDTHWNVPVRELSWVFWNDAPPRSNYLRFGRMVRLAKKAWADVMERQLEAIAAGMAK